MGKGLFLTGTGTDVGKTFTAGAILKKLIDSGRSAAYYKAAMSGNDRGPDGRLIPGDAVAVKEAADLRQSVSEMCPYVYEQAVSPHLAARLAGNPVCPNVVAAGFYALRDRYDYVLMEGSGGIVCPIRFDDTKLLLEDIVKALSLSCLIVAESGLGTINHTVLTAAYMRARHIPLKGLIFNRFHAGNEMEEDNIRMSAILTGLPVVGRIAEGGRLDTDAQSLAALFT